MALDQTDSPKVGTLTRKDGLITKPGEDTAKEMLNTHFPDNIPKKQTHYDKTRKIKSLELVTKYIDWITLDRLKKALYGSEAKQSPGPDGLQPLVLKQLTHKKIQELIFIYKTMLHFSYTPTILKGSRVIWIPKPGKDDYQLPKSWRPISKQLFAQGLRKTSNLASR